MFGKSLEEESEKQNFNSDITFLQSMNDTMGAYVHEFKKM